jgi:hypothetical protein
LESAATVVAATLTVADATQRTIVKPESLTVVDAVQRPGAKSPTAVPRQKRKALEEAAVVAGVTESPDVKPSKEAPKKKRKPLKEAAIVTVALREKGVKIRESLNQLHSITPIPLNHGSPFQLLIAVMLSAQVSSSRPLAHSSCLLVVSPLANLTAGRKRLSAGIINCHNTALPQIAIQLYTLMMRPHVPVSKLCADSGLALVGAMLLCIGIRG